MNTPASSSAPITVAYVPVTQILPLCVACEKGLFAREGLTIHLLPLPDPSNVLDALVSGKAQAGSGPALMSLVTLQQVPESFKILGLAAGSSTRAESFIQDAFLTLRESPLHTLADLRGHKLGITPGIQWQALTRYILKKNGLAPDHDVQVEERPLNQHIPALLRGEVDATFSLEPVGAVGEATGRVIRKEANISSRYVVDPFPGGAFLVSQALINDHPHEAALFAHVLQKTMIKVQADFPMYKPLLARDLNLDSSQLEHVPPQLYLSADTPEAIGTYQKLADIFGAEGLLAPLVDVHTVLYAPTRE